MPTVRGLADRFGDELQTISVAGADDDAARLRALAASALGVDAGTIGWSGCRSGIRRR
jgi:hypothetical protein